ncbi:MAG: DUF58 domain-containing protein [Methylophilus sp.]|uniref:DUF58 domain-containing protein n=1 Tax=Methylophilus sp. TaxID=29541 RepID=UPI003FA1811C
MATLSAPPVNASEMTSSSTSVHAVFEPSQFFYNINWRSKTYHAGATLTTHHGNGSDFAGFASLLACPDPKRIDIRASVRTVPRQWLVRTYLERAAVRVYAIVDVSSSMFFEGEANMRQQVTEFVSSLAWSANRQGDAFGMRAADDHEQAAWQVLPSFQPGTAQAVAQQITRFWQQASFNHSDGRSANAMPETLMSLGPQRALVFLLSDFYWPDALLQQTLQAAQHHDVIPVVLRDRAATAGLPTFGWARLRDMETGAERSWMLRRRLHQQIASHAEQQKQALDARFLKAGTRSPLWLTPGWRAEEVSRHLMETMS